MPAARSASPPLVDTAGAPVIASPEIVDLGSAEAESLDDRLLRDFRSARARGRADDGGKQSSAAARSTVDPGLVDE